MMMDFEVSWRFGIGLESDVWPTYLIGELRSVGFGSLYLILSP